MERDASQKEYGTFCQSLLLFASIGYGLIDQSGLKCEQVILEGKYISLT